MSDDQTLQQLRDQAQAIAERVRTDPAFVQQIKEDPAGTLSDAGIPENVIQDLIQGKTVNSATEEADVEGYGFCRDGTCWYEVSLCPWSCYITF